MRAAILMMLALAGCPERQAPRRTYTVDKPTEARPDSPPAKPHHSSHEHPHGKHPHSRDAHHHHAHVHPHVEGPNGHHHPY